MNKSVFLTFNWRHVPSELNPADVLSRGCRSDKLMKTKSWLSGPEFLSELPDKSRVCIFDYRNN